MQGMDSPIKSARVEQRNSWEQDKQWIPDERVNRTDFPPALGTSQFPPHLTPAPATYCVEDSFFSLMFQSMRSWELL